jgi:glyoxylase-like metal-dependent hydrolase (beta-lactamase superfamily II)
MPFLRPPGSFSPAAEIAGFRTVMVNYYFVRVPGTVDSWVLIDAGLPGSGPRLLREARARFSARAPEAILLTHGHFDHVGALRHLQQEWPRTPVYAHRDELPFLNADQSYPPPDPSVGGGLLALSSPLYPKHVGKFARAVQPLPADGQVPELPGWKWLHTPGHSPGHVSFWRASDRVLIAGDALINTRQESAWFVFRQKPEVRPPPAYFTPDWSAAFESLVRLRSLEPEMLASGHGRPAFGAELRSGLASLIEDFPNRGLPRHGRYVPRTPAPA